MKIMIEKGYGKCNKIHISEFKGKKFFQIMEMWRERPEDEWKFSKKNVSFNSENFKEFYKFILDNGEKIMEELK